MPIRGRPRPSANPLAAFKADHQRASQPRSTGNRNGIDIGQAHVSLLQRLIENGVDGAHVLARSDFGEDAAIFLMNGNLGGDHVREHDAAVFDDGGSSLVAGGFDAKNADFVQITRFIFRIHRSFRFYR